MVSSREKKSIKLSCVFLFAIAAISSVYDVLEDDVIAESSLSERRYLSTHQKTNAQASLCTQYECKQDDPPGEIALGMYRGISQLLHWKDCDKEPQCTLAYLLMPKSGSTTIKNSMNISEHSTQQGYLSPDDGTFATNYNPLIFTVIRNPTQRIVSAYSTLLARGGLYGWVNGRDYFLPRQPEDVTDIKLWKRHFQDSIHQMMSTVKTFGWANTPSADSHWNEHIVPQVEWMKGLNVSHIGCVDAIDDVLDRFNLPHPLEDNYYEHNETTMPKEKYASFDLIDGETRELIMELYADDIKFFQSKCDAGSTSASS